MPFFLKREHALAFGCSLASSTRSSLFLHSPDGSYVDQTNERTIASLRDDAPD